MRSGRATAVRILLRRVTWLAERSVYLKGSSLHIRLLFRKELVRSEDTLKILSIIRLEIKATIYIYVNMFCKCKL